MRGKRRQKNRELCRQGRLKRWERYKIKLVITIDTKAPKGMFKFLWGLYIGNFRTTTLTIKLPLEGLMLRENLFSSQYRIVYIVCQEKNNTIYSFLIFYSYLKIYTGDCEQLLLHVF